MFNIIKSLKNKYQNMSEAVKASFWFVVTNVVTKGISVITLPIFARLLSPEDYGTISVYYSWESIISIITTLTLWGGVFNVVMSKHPDSKYKIVSAFQGLAISLTLLFFFVTIIFIDKIKLLFKLDTFYIICMYIEILSSIPYNMWSAEQRYSYKYKSLIIITIIISVLNPVIGIIAVINTIYKVQARIICGLVIQTTLSIFLFFVNTKKGKRFFDYGLWKTGFTFNVVLIPHYLSTQILNQSDRLMINSICSSSDAGIYSMAYTFGSLINLITSGISSSLTPYIYKKIKSDKLEEIKTQINVIVSIVAIITVSIILIIPDIFYLLLPDEYYYALKSIPPITAGMFFLFLYPLFGSVEFYYGENKYVTFASIIGAILNIILNDVFIRIYGYMAAAYTTLFCYCCFSICHYLFMKKVLRNNNIFKSLYDIKTISIISVFVVFMSIFSVILYDNIVIRWILILVFCLIILLKKQDIVSIYHFVTKKE